MGPMKRILITAPGSPSMLRLEEVSSPSPGPGEVLVAMEWAGVNFIDIKHRSGEYPLASYPSPLGYEGAGRVIGVGPGVESGFWGKRWGFVPFLVVMQSNSLFLKTFSFFLPESISTQLAASALSSGTYGYYAHRVCPYP